MADTFRTEEELLAIFALEKIFQGDSPLISKRSGQITMQDMRDLIVSVSAEFYLEVSKGNVTGHTALAKFGRNIEVDAGVTADIWDGGYTVASGGTSLIWVAPTAARIHQIVSDSASDDGSPAGVGAQTLRVYGLTGWSTAETSEDITLNGTTNVATSNSYVIIHRMQVLTKGATNVNVGTITATADTDSTVTAIIRPGEGQTQMAIYGFPSTQSLYLNSWYASLNKDSGGVATGYANAILKFNPEPDTELTNYLTKGTLGITLDGGPHFSHEWSPPNKFTGPGIIKVQADSATANMDVSAGFGGCLIDN